jgi:hypothetical protein
MNHSLRSADRRTHMKIVVVGLLSAMLVAVVGISAQVSKIDPSVTSLIKAGRSTALSGGLPAIR